MQAQMNFYARFWYFSDFRENGRIRLMEKRLWMICTTHMFIEIYLLIQVALIPVIVREFQLSLLEASLIATMPSIVSLLINIPSGFWQIVSVQTTCCLQV